MSGNTQRFAEGSAGSPLSAGQRDELATGGEVGSRVSAASLRAVKRVAVPVASAIGSLAAVDTLIYLASPGPLTPAALYALVDTILILGVLVIYLLGGRSALFREVEVAGNRISSLEKKAQQLDEAAALAARLKTELDSTKEGKATAERDRDALAAAKDELAARVNELTARNAELQARVQTAERRAGELETAANSLRQDLLGERTTTARSAYIPSLEVSARTTGFGILAYKTAHVKIRNLGPGVAMNVQLDVAAYDGHTSPQFRSAAFWSAVGVREEREVPVGDLSEFGLPNSLATRVTFQSQYGPCSPVNMTFTLS